MAQLVCRRDGRVGHLPARSSTPALALNLYALDLMHRKPLTIDAWEGFRISDFDGRIKSGTSEYGPTIPGTRNHSCLRILLQITSHGMNYNIATILAVIAILFVLLTYVTGAPLVPVAVI